MSKGSISIISLPWGMIQEPALGPSILVSSLRSRGYDARVHYFQHRLLKHLSYESYTRLADVFALNDFVFAGAINPEFDEIQSSTLDTIADQLWRFNPKWYNDPRFTAASSIRDYVLKIRNEIIPGYLEECADAVLQENPGLVAFSCLYDQTISSLALARLIRKRRPDIRIIMGGYAVRGPVARHIADTFDWIDSVVEGPGEDIIVEFARAAAAGEAEALPPGLAGAITATNLIENSPTPDYSDFEKCLAQLSCDFDIEIDWRVVPYESSRGCWWGQKSHCIFCGIKKEDLAYSFKSDSRVLEDLVELNRRHGKTVFRFVDYIIPLDYFDTLFPRLRSQGSAFRLTCETKSNLSAERIRALAASGFAEVQPGIESFSTSVLKGMRKGVTSSQNVNFIRTAFEEGMIVHYNILYGFTFDTAEEVRRMTQAIPLFHHLPPPATVVEVLTTRFSPMQEQGYSIGQPSSKAHQHYDVVFSRSWLERMGFNLSLYCYYFESLIPQRKELEECYADLLTAVNRWSQIYYVQKSAYLLYEEDEAGIAILDSRTGEPSAYRLNELQGAVLRACLGGPHNFITLSRKMGIDEGKLVACVDELLKLGLLFGDDGMFAALPIRRDCLADNYAMDMRDRVAA